jgi:hypothetical protein
MIVRKNNNGNKIIANVSVYPNWLEKDIEKQAFIKNKPSMIVEVQKCDDENKIKIHSLSKDKGILLYTSKEIEEPVIRLPEISIQYLVNLPTTDILNEHPIYGLKLIINKGTYDIDYDSIEVFYDNEKINGAIYNNGDLEFTKIITPDNKNKYFTVYVYDINGNRGEASILCNVNVILPTVPNKVYWGNMAASMFTPLKAGNLTAVWNNANQNMDLPNYNNNSVTGFKSGDITIAGRNITFIKDGTRFIAVPQILGHLSKINDASGANVLGSLFIENGTLKDPDNIDYIFYQNGTIDDRGVQNVTVTLIY